MFVCNKGNDGGPLTQLKFHLLAGTELGKCLLIIPGKNADSQILGECSCDTNDLEIQRNIEG